MTDRSRGPRRSPDPVPASAGAADHQRCGSRRRWGPHRIGYHLGVPRSTVGRVLARYRMPLLAHLDQATGLPVRRPRAVRYEAPRPGSWSTSTSRSSAGSPTAAAAPAVLGPHRRRNREQASTSGGRGYAFLHHAVDDHSRLAYSEILADERKETAAGVLDHAPAPSSPPPASRSRP